MANEQEMQVGKVVQVIGAVVDIAFDDDKELPAIYNAIHVKDDKASVPVDVICETMQHLGDGVVPRCCNEFHRRHGTRHESR